MKQDSQNHRNDSGKTDFEPHTSCPKSVRFKGTTIWFLWGGGAGGLKWAGEFFLPIFRAGEFFSPARIIFFKKLTKLFSLNRGGGGGGGGEGGEGFDIHPCSSFTRIFFSRIFLFPRNTSFLSCEKSFPKYNELLEWVKQFTECEKQILECESRFRTAKGGFWSAKTGFGVRKRFLCQEFFLPALWAREFFFAWNQSRKFFFAKSSCTPP